MKKYRVLVYGRVQGVGFRRYARKNAVKYRIKGWVRNNENGTVEIIVQGLPSRIGQFIGKILIGPKRAKVDSIEVSPIKGRINYRDFEIRR
ncbi:acylphosphatase [Thalassobacillus sp. C254]|uniref:acylphosphatase n=1 Tax=Thalassobacillus sp. C254 TaxID=1225341 RepID=UPI0006D22675|nr:acylphosphatase [Thalassobacillus sp. C254]